MSKYDIKIIEGFPLYYRGIVYLVKGIQHPKNKVIAYPRYSFIDHRKINRYEIMKYVSFTYWDCIRQKVPMIDVLKAFSFFEIFDKYISYKAFMVRNILSDLLDLDNLFITGSSLISPFHNDVDIVIPGADNDLVSEIKSLLMKGVFKRIHVGILVKEYFSKHKYETDLSTYLHLKKDTLSHFFINNVHVNIKYLSYIDGFNYCIDPVIERENFVGRVRVVDYVNKHVLPTKYIVRIGSEEILMETFREIYSEIPIGEYYVKGYIEYRRVGKVLVPDHGFVYRIS